MLGLVSGLDANTTAVLEEGSPVADGALSPEVHPRTPADERTDSKGRHLVRATVVGLLAGLAAVAFRWSLAVSEAAREGLIERVRHLPHSTVWGWSVLPMVGLTVGCLVGWLVVRFAPDAPGSGIPHVKGVLLHLRTMRWKALLPVKFIGGAVGIGAGLSLGREGPTVQMGAAIGQAVGDLLRVPSRSLPQLLSCGAGAGIAAAFNAPLAGFLFVIEELHRELSTRTFAGALVAAISADIVARALAGDLPSFAITGFPGIPLAALPVAAVVGIVGGALGVMFNRSLLSSSAMALRTTAVPKWMLPGLAGALCGLVAWWLPQAVGGGHLTAEQLLGGQLGWGIAALAMLLVVKFALTIISYASGAPGGIFAPMLLLGAIVGAMVGHGVAGLFPSLQPHATAFAILGMAAWFTGSVRAPLTGIVLIVEMTGNYQQLLPLAVTCLLADLTASALGDTPIYEALLEADLHRRPASLGSSRLASPTEVSSPRSVYIGVQRDSQMEGQAIRNCGLPGGCLVIGIERSGREILPEANFVLLPGDHLTVVVPDDEAEKALEIVKLATGY